MVICEPHEVLFTKDVSVAFDQYLKKLSQKSDHLVFHEFAEIPKLVPAICLHYFIHDVTEEVDEPRLKVGGNNHGLGQLLVVVMPQIFNQFSRVEPAQVKA